MPIFNRNNNATIIAVFPVLMIGAFVNGLSPSIAGASGALSLLLGVSYSRWSMEASTLLELGGGFNNNAALVLYDRIGLCGIESRYDPPCRITKFLRIYLCLD